MKYTSESAVVDMHVEFSRGVVKLARREWARREVHALLLGGVTLQAVTAMLLRGLYFDIALLAVHAVFPVLLLVHAAQISARDRERGFGDILRTMGISVKEENLAKMLFLFELGLVVQVFGVIIATVVHPALNSSSFLQILGFALAGIGVTTGCSILGLTLGQVIRTGHGVAIVASLAVAGVLGAPYLIPLFSQSQLDPSSAWIAHLSPLTWAVHAVGAYKAWSFPAPMYAAGGLLLWIAGLLALFASVTLSQPRSGVGRGDRVRFTAPVVSLAVAGSLTLVACAYLATTLEQEEQPAGLFRHPFRLGGASAFAQAQFELSSGHGQIFVRAYGNQPMRLNLTDIQLTSTTATVTGFSPRNASLALAYDGATHSDELTISFEAHTTRLSGLPQFVLSFQLDGERMATGVQAASVTADGLSPYMLAAGAASILLGVVGVRRLRTP